MSYYFVNVPKLPKQVSHQMGTLELVEYRAKEGEKVDKGQVIAIVQNWWARMALKSIGPGYLSKTFFTKGTRIKEGDPLAITLCDPEDGPSGKDTSEIEIIESIRTKSL